MITLNLDPTWENPTEELFILADKFNFSGGEVHVKIREFNHKPSVVMIKHRVNNSQGLMELVLAADAVRRELPETQINAYIPYLPYARQDKPMVKGEPFSLMVLADILATAKFNKIYTLDPHSDVAAALIRNLAIVEPDFLKQAFVDIRHNNGDFLLCAPDGGALKKIYKQAKFINYNGSILCGGKVRDLTNGKILRTTLDTTGEDITGKTVVIIDDICSRGGTFQGLSKVLKEYGAKHVILIVSHYEGVADEALMSQAGIDKIYTTNSINNEETELVKKYLI